MVYIWIRLGSRLGARAQRPYNMLGSNYKLRKEGKKMKVRGIDTIEFGIDVGNYEKVLESFLAELDRLKLRAQEEHKAQVIEIGNINFNVNSKGQGIFAYKLECEDFHLAFASKSIRNTPPIYVRFISQYLWSLGYEEAIQRFMEWLPEALQIHVTADKLSRLDICLDIDEITFVENDVHFLVTKARKQEVCYVDSIHYLGKNFSGFVIGKGSPLSCRIYSKTREITTSNKKWFKEIWKQNGWNEEDIVWRVEFQLRRKVLKELGISKLEEIAPNIDLLWKYLTVQWLSIREMTDKTNITRCNIDNRWLLVQNGGVLNKTEEKLVRKAVRNEQLEILLNECDGLILSICAITEKDKLYKVFPVLSDHLYNSMRKKHTSFEKEVEKRKNRFLKEK